MNDVYNYETFKGNRTTNYPISSLCLNDNYLFITCSSGKANKYNLMIFNSKKMIIPSLYIILSEILLFTYHIIRKFQLNIH